MYMYAYVFVSDTYLNAMNMTSREKVAIPVDLPSMPDHDSNPLLLFTYSLH